MGTLIGLFTAYFGGILDTLFMRLVDVMMSFPVIVLIIAIVAVLGPGIGNMYLAMWLVGWTSYARLVRSAVMVEKTPSMCRPRVRWAILTCASCSGIFFPTSSPAHRIRGFRRIDVHAHGCGLSFLGVGVQPPPRSGAPLFRAAVPFCSTRRGSAFFPASSWPSRAWGSAFWATVLQSFSK